MAVAEVKLSSLGGTGTITGSDRSNVLASYTANYRVRCDSAADQADAIWDYFRTSADHPYIGKSFKFGNGYDTNSVCRSMDAQAVEKSGGWFNVRMNFEPAEGAGGPSHQQADQNGKMTDNPLDWRDEIDVTRQPIFEPAYFGIFRGFEPNVENQLLQTGRAYPIVNSAIQTYEPTLEKEARVKYIRITKYQGSYDGSAYDAYDGKVNNDAVVIDKPAYRFRESFGQYRGRLSIHSSFGINAGISYYRTTLEVAVHPTSWRRRVLDQGMCELYRIGDEDVDGTTLSSSDFPTNRQFNLKGARDNDTDHPIVQMANLDGKGKMLDPEDDPITMVWSLDDEISFAGINW